MHRPGLVVAAVNVSGGGNFTETWLINTSVMLRTDD